MGAGRQSRGGALRSEYSLVIFMTVAAAVAGLVAGLLTVLMQDPLYRAGTSVSLRATSADLGVAEAADRLAANTAAWVESESFAARLTDEERGGLSVRAIADHTAARALPKEMRLVIEFEDESPGRAADVVDGLARVAVATARADLSSGGLEIAQIELARVPENPIRPLPRMALPLGSVLGALAGLALGLVFKWYRDPLEATV